MDLPDDDDETPVGHCAGCGRLMVRGRRPFVAVDSDGCRYETRVCRRCVAARSQVLADHAATIRARDQAGARHSQEQDRSSRNR